MVNIHYHISWLNEKFKIQSVETFCLKFLLSLMVGVSALGHEALILIELAPWQKTFVFYANWFLNKKVHERQMKPRVIHNVRMRYLYEDWRLMWKFLVLPTLFVCICLYQQNIEQDQKLLIKPCQGGKKTDFADQTQTMPSLAWHSHTCIRIMNNVQTKFTTKRLMWKFFLTKHQHLVVSIDIQFLSVLSLFVI